MSEEFQEALKLLCSHAKLDRDKGLLSLKIAIQKQKNKSDSSCKHLEDQLLTHLMSSSAKDTWEEIHGHLEACRSILDNTFFSEDFSESALICGLKFLEHDEFRVRISAGELLGTLCKVVDVNIYHQCEPVLMNSIRSNLTRDIINDASSEHTKDAKEIFHDTAGWKCLETSMKGLQSIIEGCGESFLQQISTNLLNLLFETLKHTNRFVRETGFYLCASLARYGVSSKEGANKEIADKLAEHLQVGLADNWSQVRLAASVANRQFFADMNEKDKQIYFKILLPPMCLNRYYLAEGVKLYNQESWRQILGTEGRKNVAIFIEEITQFYVNQTESDNHAVREAACHCMAELSSKIDPNVVRPYVQSLLDALYFCFQDDSWPVRDTACIACGNFMLNFPEESRSLLEKLYPLFFANLHDPIPSVRQGAAVSLKNVAKVYGEDAIEFIFQKILEGFQGIKAQKTLSERYEGLDKGAATFGVIKQLRDNDFELHSNQQMYSCGSLAPKMGRGGRSGGGCMDHSFKRNSEPWEVADGCVYLLSEMSSLPNASGKVQSIIPELIKITEQKQYTHHLQLFETICKILPNIAKGLNKRNFKPFIEQFLNIIFYCLTCEIALTKSAAIECLQFLSNFLGPSILRGRVEENNPAHMHLLEETLNNKQNQHV